MIKFQKFHGTGNDFIIFKESDLRIDDYSILAKRVCDRHFGIGADGMIIISESTNADIRMKFYNADGSIASMCGNGIRCFSKFVYDNKLVDKKKFTVETLAGIMKPEVIVENNEVTFVKVNLGKPVFLSNEIPKGNNSYFINEEIKVEGIDLAISSLVVGTIHTILFVNDFSDVDIKAIGYSIEHNKIFPIKTNVNFCKVIDRENIEVITWEKGVGITLACGTGAASSAVISTILKGCANKLNVKVLGGNLIIEQKDEEIFMTGPAEFICRGEYKFI
ncbi:Diaminopimelate epimerase [uncultured Clostridium sp.]|uniref:diaminopimelate epimerase n=1 Tax=uncultured Clostridium sp. TaxID=59620 RepID=UPI000821BDD8|nr:diaminopimelate epimerase [uncultured Clostridium sp.]SCJ98859.1 Diaminopimelate epimerase [uncultured Clostridium sp.]